MSTRYADQWEFDHGAQFFTVQDIEFRAEIDAAIAAGVVAPWMEGCRERGVYLTKNGLDEDIGRSRFVGAPRMNQLPKYWAEGLDIELGRRVSSIRKSSEKSEGAAWALLFEDGTMEAGFDAVISTLPPEQAAKVLPPEYETLKSVEASSMNACFSLMVGFADPIDLKWDTLRVKDLPIDWIAVNNRKPGRNHDVGALVIQSSPDWSNQHADSDRGWVQKVMLNTASALVGQRLEQAPHIALHRWLYASNKVSPERITMNSGGLIVTGDWCSEGRVQGAWLSGRAAAHALL